MPRVLRSYDFHLTSQIYPWKRWLDGRVRQFKRREDFRCEPLSFVGAARFWAKRRGFNVRASVSGGTVTMQALLGKRGPRKA